MAPWVRSTHTRPFKSEAPWRVGKHHEALSQWRMKPDRHLWNMDFVCLWCQIGVDDSMCKQRGHILHLCMGGTKVQGCDMTAGCRCISSNIHAQDKNEMAAMHCSHVVDKVDIAWGDTHSTLTVSLMWWTCAWVKMVTGFMYFDVCYMLMLVDTSVFSNLLSAAASKPKIKLIKWIN